MDFGRIGPSDPGGSSRRSDAPIIAKPTSSLPNSSPSNKRKLIFLAVVATALIVGSAISAGIVIGGRARRSDQNGVAVRGKPTEAISRTCSKTQYPNLCVNSLLEFPGSTRATEQELVHISFNMTLQHLSKALYSSNGISYVQMDPLELSAYEDCLELLEDSIDALARSLTSVAPSPDDGSIRAVESPDDVMTWLSAALTSQDTCAEGLAEARGSVRDQMANNLKDLSELVSNSLAIFSSSGSDGGDFSGVPIQNRRRLMGENNADEWGKKNPGNFPKWLSRRDRRLLSLPVSEIQADIVVSKEGNGTVKTIAEAIKMAPEHSSRRFIIYLRAGRYEEKDLKVGRKKTNLMLIGDGMGKSIIRGKKNVMDGLTTFHTASFAATGAGFIARDITFENYAGPSKHQAVALRVGSDHAVVHRCEILGYQDTCYVHSNRQFFRECRISGTVDFIFGNAAVVFQNCSLYARKPMDQQKNTITAQNRKDPNQNTGISIHNCQILPDPDLEPEKGSVSTYHGRPWKLYSRTVYMLSFMDDHIHPRGWLEWDASFALDTLYYGEYMNYGPGAAVGKRVRWPGYRVITSQVEARRFTVAEFISGSSWLPSTGVAFLAGLST
ncbi:hypothetical protein K1719_025682 [Acacia pycnantha]|nr:hypothetical protein K1719_025682 [Acacia pycnantha]